MLAVGIDRIKACCVNVCSLGTFPDTTGETEYFVNNGEWDLIEIKSQPNVHNYICCKEPYPDVTFTLHVRRRTLFYYMNLLIPCFLLTGS